MNKTIPLILTTLMSLALVSCKSGSISGKVLDPFTGKPVENSTIWLDNTPMQLKSADGSFHFEKLKVGSYKIMAGKNKSSKTSDTISVTEKSWDATKDVYIYSRETYDPGLYQGAQKITNLWLNWESSCKESKFGYRKQFLDSKTKKPLVLPNPMNLTSSVQFLFYQQSSASEAVVAKSFPLVEGKIADHKDCQGFDAKDPMGYFPDLNKAVELKSAFKSDMLYEFTGELPKGKQVIAMFQGEKLVKTYFFEVK